MKIISDFEMKHGNCIAVINCKITNSIINRLSYYSISKVSYFASDTIDNQIRIIGVWKHKK